MLTNPFTCVVVRELVSSVAETLFLTADAIFCGAVGSIARYRG